jgi:GNAT superfamily N-acetyltransferase
MFTPPDLAAKIDRAEGRLCAGIADGVSSRAPELRSHVWQIGGGVAVFAGPKSPTNKMIAVGYDGVPAEGELDLIERAFAERQAPLQAEIATLADPGLHTCLARRGYEPRGFENVLGHPLAALDQRHEAEIVIDRVAPAETREWIEVFVTAFANPDTGGVGGDTIPPSDALREWVVPTMSLPGFEGFLARIGGQIVGGAALRIDGDIAQFCGAGTLPAYRRRGVQSALLRARLRRARDARCTVAVVVTQPASKSQQNVHREGFHLLYARQLFVKPNPSVRCRAS